MSDFIAEKQMDSIRKIQLSDSQYKLYSGLKKELRLADHQVMHMTWGELKKNFQRSKDEE
ncbi:hypothetical protein BHT95_21150 [Bacillus paralicheniformis]|uniref:hypothetical protein n=1 Tax=Bacillus paralicheniformis TaxID=1648923 RepID=UPI000681CC4D|nr:hypothetical protein [Bacillus paralicheniformis]KND05472.1 hypothetical protein ACJ43_21545 [Bacillus paralicheniformis]OLQ51326.1 hypothetical protein BHT95_21150 [Bacillus paralicheniformis]